MQDGGLHLQSIAGLDVMVSMRLVDKALELAQKVRIKQGELARMIGVDPSRMSEWKKDDGKPSIEQALRMARALGVTLDYLADDTIDEPEAQTLTVDEEMALRLYRQFRERFEHPADATLALTRFVAAHTDDAEPPPGPAAFLGRADLSELDAAREREEKRPKKVGGGKPRTKVKGGGGRGGG